MDPLSHVVMGRAVIGALEPRTGARFGRSVSATAIVGALIPDIDCVLMPFGWDVYLRLHQVGTHSLAGAVALGAAVGLLIGAGSRHGRVEMSAPTVHSARLAAAGSVAALSHLLLDLLSGAPIGLAWPMRSTMFTVPLVAMAEPWLVALFGVGALAMWHGRSLLQRPAIGVLVAASLFFAVKSALLSRVTGTIAGDPRFSADTPRALEARWGSWVDWNVFERDDQALRAWRVNAMNGAISPVLRWPEPPESPLIRASRSLDTVQNFLSAHRLDLAIERRHGDGAIEVLWSDVRYCWLSPPAADLQCALWFGGVYDRDGHPLRQVVHLGDWRQTRDP